MNNLYALQRDLNMVVQDVEWLKKPYNLLDYIAKVVHDCELEQLAQAAQMRRMENRFKEIEDRLNKVEARLDRVEARLDKIENRLANIENTLDLIVRRLGIQREL